MSDLTPTRPYLIRAYYEWLLDNGLTPHIVVDAFVTGTRVPQQFVKDGQIVLNIAESAISGLLMDNEFVEFSARFGGVPHQILLPMASIMAIYASENGAGTVFEMEEAYLPSDEEQDGPIELIDSEQVEQQEQEVEQPSTDDKPPKKRGHLTVVK
ncbi:MAG: ClpXP protease specificity-enhancing factor [Parashewanella sp.]